MIVMFGLNSIYFILINYMQNFNIEKKLQQDLKTSINLGPVVQSIVSLTRSLRGQLVKSFTTL